MHLASLTPVVIKLEKFSGVCQTTWQTKVVTLESQDLNKLSYDELRGELIAFERMHLKKSSQEEKKIIVAFKTSTEIVENEIDDDPEALQEKIVMLSRNMDGLMRRYMSTKKGRIPPRRSKQYNEQDKNDGKCYECGRFGHIQTECPELKRKISRGFNKNKSFGSWNDEDNSDHEEIANLCFMTILENEINKSSRCWTNENTSDEENENCFMARGETSEDGFGNQKAILNLVILTLQDPDKLGYLKESNHHVLQEHHRISHKGKWYLDSVCSSHMTGDKNLFKEVTKIDGGSVMFGDDSKGKIICTGTIPLNNNCDITEVYLVDGLNYDLLSIIQLCNSGYEVNFKKTGCAIEDESGKIVLPGKRYGNVYILDSFEKIDGHICLSSMSDDPWLWHRKLGHASIFDRKIVQT
ncbi:uncharacterized protein LOC142162102 [Nicotiana tabacum]|uniref:Uncharacterized protein LOC142162102 n=1 Tax=Nicotiana tabacum TaxID=4097 RepID=A0AC58RP69_TOBAC